MNNRLLPTIIFHIIVLASCGSDRSDATKPPIENKLKTITVNCNFDQFVPNSAIFKNIYPIVLETNDDCLIKSIRKTVIREHYIIIQNHRLSILVFDLDGRFLRKIGSRGKGAGEYFHVTDFDVDEDLNIHICTGYKILIYTIEGKFLKSLDLNLKIDNIPVASEQIISNSDGGYYLWKTYQSMDPIERNQHSLLRIDKKQNIIDQNIPLKRNVLNNTGRFHQFNDYYNVDPPYGLDTIFAASEKGVFANYFIDFGNRTLPRPIPEWEEFSDYRAKMDSEDYVTSISRFIETDNWIFFRFILKRYIYNAYYSKTDNKVFVNKPDPNDPPHESFVMRIDGEWKGKVFSCIEPVYLHDKIDLMESPVWKDKQSKKDFDLIQTISQVPISNNPIILICETK